MVTAEQLDIAVAAGVARVAGPNLRPCRCAVCGRLCGDGQARRLWIDGHRRGYVCRSCQWDQQLRGYDEKAEGEA